MKSASPRNLVIISNENPKLLKKLEKKLKYKRDSRIKFVGTLYDQELLKKVRENAFGYIHGHEVGGTNPSLLESMGSTDLNLLFDVVFNREVGSDAALYWTKDEGNLSGLINEVDKMSKEDRAKYGTAAKERIESSYNWRFIGDEYKRLWNEGKI